MITQQKSFLQQKQFAAVTPFDPSLLRQEQQEQGAFDQEYETWKREHGLDQPLTAQQVNDICQYELGRM